MSIVKTIKDWFKPQPRGRRHPHAFRHAMKAKREAEEARLVEFQAEMQKAIDATRAQNLIAQNLKPKTVMSDAHKAAIAAALKKYNAKKRGKKKCPYCTMFVVPCNLQRHIAATHPEHSSKPRYRHSLKTRLLMRKNAKGRQATAEWDAAYRHARLRYQSQKSRSKNRGIAWELTFEQWYNWWQQSGHWHERGRKRNQWVMARIGDQGPYALDNIKCITQAENHSDAPVRIAAVKKAMTGKKKTPKQLQAWLLVIAEVNKRHVGTKWYHNVKTGDRKRFHPGKQGPDWALGTGRSHGIKSIDDKVY